MAVWKHLMRLKILKTRVYAGFEGDDEVEDFANDEERQMTEDELNQLGRQFLEERNQEAFTRALHFFRLSALRHNSSYAAIVLSDVYEQLKSPVRAAYFLVRRAQMDDCDPKTNFMAMQYHVAGKMLFSPFFALVVYYAQRAALSGNVDAMLELHLTYATGVVNSPQGAQHSALQEKHRSESLAMMWLQHAANRGSPVAYDALAKNYSGKDDNVAEAYKGAFGTFTKLK